VRDLLKCQKTSAILQLLSVGIALTQPSRGLVIKLCTKSSVSALAYADVNCPGDTGSNSGFVAEAIGVMFGVIAEP